MMYDFGEGLVTAHQHPRGGGWVADSAQVADSAYVGKHARVSGEAQVSGISVKGFTETLGGNTATSFDRGYGIHLHEDSVGSTILRYAVFVDGSNGQPADKRLERLARIPPDAADETGCGIVHDGH